MLTEQEKKALLKKADECKKGIAQLKAQLNQINDQKENSFSKKDEISKHIAKLISEAKNSKTKRNELTKQVRESKSKREEYNKQISDRIMKIKELEKEKNEILRKHNIKEDPSSIKRLIDKLEYGIETEVMSFQKEQKVMKQIKELRKKYNEAKNISGVWETISKLSNEMNDLRKNANDFHHKVQVSATQSQEKHEQVLEASKEIDELRQKEEDAYKKFFELKKQFVDVNNKLKAKLLEMNEINSELSKNKLEVQKQVKAKQEKTIEEKKKTVQEKMKKGGKLTTEDLLIFQRS